MPIRTGAPIPRRITDPDLVQMVVQLMAQEEAACRLCADHWAPSHFHAFVSQGELVQNPCESGNRVFDPSLGAFVGYPHCTCDTCF